MQEAVWGDTPGAGAEQPRGAELQWVLKRAEDLSDEINSVAYTTSDVYSVRRAGASGLTTLIERDEQASSREQEIGLDTVSELHLRRVMDKKTDGSDNVAGEGGILAHKLRWLSGSGAAKTVVGASREDLPGDSNC